MDTGFCQTRASTRKGGGAIIWQIFCRKLHANERNWTEREVHLGHSLVDRHSKILELHFPSRSNFLHFDVVFGRFWSNNRLAPSPLELASPLWEILDPLQSCGRNQLRNNKSLQQNGNSVKLDLGGIEPFHQSGRLRGTIHTIGQFTSIVKTEIHERIPNSWITLPECPATDSERWKTVTVPDKNGIHLVIETQVGRFPAWPHGDADAVIGC